MAEHKHAAILRAIADGEKIQCRYVSNETWWPSDFEEFCRVAEDDAYQFRVKPGRICGWINVYPQQSLCYFYHTKEEADEVSDPYRIACIPVEFDEGDGL